MEHLAHRNIPITIIGGGIHGVSIALRLLREMPTTALAVVDRHPLPLTAWRRKTERQGMKFLRSPAVHHITPDALGIVEYAERHNRTDELAPPYSQPSTQLFWEYCCNGLKEIGKHQNYYQFEVAKLRWDKGTGKYPFRLISTENVGFRSSHVILAIGADDCYYVPPEFVPWQRRWPERIVHAAQFSVSPDKREGQALALPTEKQTIAIVGGGLTAGTLARCLSERGYEVVLIARRQLKTEQFDFPPIWLGPKALAEFASEPDFQQRYETVQQVRREGSITPDVAEALKDAPRITLYTDTCIRNITEEPGQTLRLHLESSGGFQKREDTVVNVAGVILATGYRFNLRRYPFLAELIAQYEVPLVCGLPKLDENLQLSPVTNLFGTGSIAQLQLGPAAGNIAGASLAYERLREKILPQFV